MDYFTALLHRAGCAASAAADACRAWEDGADPVIVSDTAWAADQAVSEAIEALAGIEPALAQETDPETRLGRLVMAARLLVLAGTDEGGQSWELEMAAKLLKLAIDA